MNGYEKLILGLILGFVAAYLLGPKKVLIVTTDLEASGRDLTGM